ncbi:MAG: hypothetical protein ACHP84_10360 [Caulobacterales bacterium]|jgi:hypothetical protein
MTPAATDISRRIWEAKYRTSDGVRSEQAIADPGRRVAAAIAAFETSNAEYWRREFLKTLRNFRFAAGGPSTVEARPCCGPDCEAD